MMPQIAPQDMNLVHIGFNKAGSGSKAQTGGDGGASFDSFLTSRVGASESGTAVRQLDQQPPGEGVVSEGLEEDLMPGGIQEDELNIVGTSFAVVPEQVLPLQASLVPHLNVPGKGFLTVTEGSLPASFNAASAGAFPASPNAAPAEAFKTQSSPTQQQVMVDGFGLETTTVPLNGKVVSCMREPQMTSQMAESFSQGLSKPYDVAEPEPSTQGFGEMKKADVSQEGSPSFLKPAGLPKEQISPEELSSPGKMIPKNGPDVPEKAVAYADSQSPGDRTSFKSTQVFHSVKGKSDQSSHSGDSMGEPGLSFNAAGNSRELGSSEPGSDRSVSPFPKESFLNRLSQVIRDHLIAKSELIARQGKTELRLELKPEYLGKLFLRLSMENGTVHAKFLVENQQVRSLIENHLSQLKQNLADHGILWQEAHVDIGGFGRGFLYEERPQAEGRLLQINPGHEESVEEGEMFYPLDLASGSSISYLA